MDQALKWAEQVCPLKNLVNSGRPMLLVEPEDLGRIIHEIDTPLVNQSDLRKISAKERLERETKIANIAYGLIPTPSTPFEPYKVVSCMLRAWSGCLGCAKTIAFETRSGPNTTEQRKKIFGEKIAVLANKDPYYRMGVSAGPYLRKIRGQGFDLTGVPEHLIQEYGLRIN